MVEIVFATVLLQLSIPWPDQAGSGPYLGDAFGLIDLVVEGQRSVGMVSVDQPCRCYFGLARERRVPKSRPRTHMASLGRSADFQ